MPSNIPYNAETGKYWTIPLNFIGGCSPCSIGCANCWAADCASKRLANHRLYKGLTKNGKWTGEVRVMPELIKVVGGKPKTIFWCNMADMFHEKVAFEDISFAFRKMLWDMPQHNHLILTKRIERMAEYFEKMYDPLLDETSAPFCSSEVPDNIHLGVTICTPDELWKAKELLQIPAAYRWISFEPLLGDIDFVNGIKYPDGSDWWNGFLMDTMDGIASYLHKIVIGCESGPKRRPCKPEWIVSIVEQCQAVGIPWLVKQVEINGVVCHDPKQCNEYLGV